MTYEEAKKELEELRCLQRYIKLINERIELLSDVLSHSSDIIKMGGKDSSNQNATEAKLVKLADLKIKRDKDLARLCNKESRILDTISKIQDLRHREVLERYYIKGDKLEQVCVDMNYSFRQAIRFKNKAVREYTEKHRF